MRARKALKQTLLVNASYSSITGIISILFADKISSFLGTQWEILMVLVGVGLLLFGAAVYYIAKNIFSRKWVWFIIIQDWAWILGISIITGFQLWSISTKGYLLMVGISLPVFIFGILQVTYIKRAFQE